MAVLLSSQVPDCSTFHYNKDEYEAGDEAYILRLRMILFEYVKVEPLDHGHKIIHCWTPRER